MRAHMLLVLQTCVSLRSTVRERVSTPPCSALPVPVRVPLATPGQARNKGLRSTACSSRRSWGTSRRASRRAQCWSAVGTGTETKGSLWRCGGSFNNTALNHWPYHHLTLRSSGAHVVFTLLCTPPFMFCFCAAADRAQPRHRRDGCSQGGNFWPCAGTVRAHV
jgi:hypothetical protein